jgi:Rrf2 family protein
VRERFERVGVRKLRTMLARDNTLILSFFPRPGLTAGHLIPLELDIGPGGDMKLPKNTRLALVTLLESAARQGELLPAGEIAARYGESVHHLAKVLAELARAGVVEAVRGIGGGYRFLANPRRLTLLDVIRRFEWLDGPNGESSATRVDVALGEVLGEVDQIKRATFGSITVATLLMLDQGAGARALIQSQPPEARIDAVRRLLFQSCHSRRSALEVWRRMCRRPRVGPTTQRSALHDRTRDHPGSPGPNVSRDPGDPRRPGRRRHVRPGGAACRGLRIGRCRRRQVAG